MSTTNPNLELIRETYAAFARGDVPTVLAGFSADIEWREADGFIYAGTYRGPEAVLNNVFMRLGSEWQGFEAVPEEFVDGGDVIVALGLYRGTYNATGKAVEVPFAHVWRVREGKIQNFRQYTDTLLVDRAVTAD